MNKNRKIILTVLISAAVLILILLSVYLIGINGKKASGHNPDNSQNESPEYEELKIPYIADNGRITVESVFEMTGRNPDCENRNGENIAALQVKNTSEEHLKYANIILTVNGKTEIEFVIEDLPAQKSVMVFSKDNISLKKPYTVTDLKCITHFENETPLSKETVSYEINGTEITVKNTGRENINKLVVSCHCAVNEYYYGGLTYKYETEKLGAGCVGRINADDCLVGKADVTRITILK